MPTKNRIKQYVSDGIYHIYNRGVNKQSIFFEKADYAVFLSYIKDYLVPTNKEEIRQQLADLNLKNREKEKLIRKIGLKNYSSRISLLGYCLMPNHFHLLIHQKDERAIVEFMKSLCSRYTIFVNKKYSRVGPLFQGAYKGVLAITDEQLVHLSYYIHKQAIITPQGQTLWDLRSQRPSSLPNYLGQIKQEWVKPDRILSWFNKNSEKIGSYREFMSISSDSNSEFPIAELQID